MESMICFLCKNVSNIITLLQCNHNICSKCFFKICAFNLKTIFSSSKMNAEVTLNCFICEKETQTIKRQQIYEILKENNEDESKFNPVCEHHDKPIEFFCIQCNMRMCDECVQKHKSFSKVFASHTFINSNESSQKVSICDKTCREHLIKQYEFYCNTCEIPICIVCHKLFHSRHDIEDIKTHFNKIKLNIKFPFKTPEEINNKISEEEKKGNEYIRMENSKIIDQIQNLIDSLEDFKNNFINKNIEFEEEQRKNYEIKKNIYTHFCLFVNKISDDDYYTLHLMEKFANKQQDFNCEYFVNENIQNELEQIKKKLTDIEKSDYLIIRKYAKEINFKCIKTITGHTDYVHSLIQLNDGKIASGSADKTIRIWLSEQEFMCIKRLNEHTGIVYCLINLKDGKFASGSADKTIKVWDIEKDFKCIKTLTQHTSSVYCMTLLNNEIIVSGSHDKSIIIWDCPNSIAMVLCGHTNFVSCVIILSNNRIASASADRTIKIWGGRNGYVCLKTLTDHTDSVVSLIELKDEKLASASRDKTIRIWDQKNAFTCINVITGHNDGIYCLIQSFDGNLISGSLDKSIKIWEVENNLKCLQILTGHNNYIYCLTQLRDGKIISGSLDTTIKIWNSC